MKRVADPRLAVNQNFFPKWQAAYAEHGIATYPIANKIPAIRAPQKLGLTGSTKLATQFPNAEAFGFDAGPRNRITVVDVDSADERVLADALATYGRTPFISRTPSGGFHAWYRYNGEGRQIRPVPNVDVLGRGNVVAPPSRVTKGTYHIIQGGLDDLDSLPTMRQPAKAATGIPEGKRNTALWRHCMRHAHHCDNFDALLDVAHTFNGDCLPPLEEAEIMNVAKSAWGYTERGENRFGQYGAWFPIEEVTSLVYDEQDVFLLLAFLRSHNGPRSTFMVANDGLARLLRWRPERVATARRRLIELGYIVMLKQAGRGHPALFRWAPQSRAVKSGHPGLKGKGPPKRVAILN
jgi:hypothetical protein